LPRRSGACSDVGYFALGYTIGGNEAATAFLTNLSILLLLMMLLTAAAVVASGRLLNAPEA
jgi:hypothetical protein